MSKQTHTYSARYGHADNCVPGTLQIEADTREDAIKQAKKFVEDGYLNQTWINLTLSDTETAAYTNAHGKAVG